MISLWIRENGDPGSYQKWCEHAPGVTTAAAKALWHLLHGRDVEIVQWRTRCRPAAATQETR